MNESFHIGNLFYAMNQTSKHAKDPVFYIISATWFEKWKTYVNFDYYMNNSKLFMNLNSLPNRPDNMPSESYVTSLTQDIQDEVNKYFEKYFIADNSEHYPGMVTNKDLLYDKMTHYVNFDKPDSSMNYNIQNQLICGNDYFIVTRDIWKYFRAVYGGKEIKRYRISSSSSNNANEILIESKLKNLNLIIIKSKVDDHHNHNHNGDDYYAAAFPFSIEKPKNVFVSRRSTLSDFKKQIIDMFSFLKHVHDKDIRFWLLNQEYTSHSAFSNYVNETYDKRLNPRISLPGFNLELLNPKVKLEEIDDMLSNRLIIMEYIDSNHSHFPFKTQHLSDFSREFQDEIKAISKGKKRLNRNCYTFYDKLKIENDTQIDRTHLFDIKKFFKDKYMIDTISKIPTDDINKVLLRICDVSNENDRVEFENEITSLRDNMDLIFEQKELMQKLGFVYSTELNTFVSRKSLTRTNASGSGSGTEKRLRQDIILKKRERTKIMQQLLGKTKTNSPNERKKHGKRGCEGDIEMDEDDEWDKCGFCSKDICLKWEEVTKCKGCGDVFYCSNSCLNKDLRFHIKTCNNINENNNSNSVLEINNN